MTRNRLLCSICAALCSAAAAAAEAPLTLTVRADRPGPEINPAMWGVFFEDINFGADGGLYAELVKNRSFEFPEPLMGWSEIRRGAAADALAVREEEPFNTAQPHYLRLSVAQPDGMFGVANEGFRGIGVRQGATYHFSVAARAKDGKPSLRVELEGADGRVLASARLRGFSSGWKKHTAKLRASASDPKARLNVVVEGQGTIDLDLVSLFPADTWKGRPNGLRADLVQLLADLRPGFLRFPGGCIVEGRDLATRYQWKNTIGDPAGRRLIVNRWNTEFKNRPAPDYYQSFGLGYFEYFQLSEDLGAEPLPILNCGMACQFNTGQLVPLEELDPYIQDALDLVEFANGPASSPWGAKRAAMGHPRPFNLKLLGVGNEQWGPQYVERYTRFARALKARHPDIQLVAAAGPDPGDDRFKFLWSQFRELKADLVDEHFYRSPDWFLGQVHRYDKYDRAGPKVFAGEYAAHVRSRANNLQSALAEAAVMTGFERNADVVRMASYAPLFAHAEAWQWRPNLIWFDNLRVVATPDYYVQQLFSRNRGDVVLPAEIGGQSPASNGREQFSVSACRESKAGVIILKVVNQGAEPVVASLGLEGVRKLSRGATATILTGASLEDENTLDQPRKIAPRTEPVRGAVAGFNYTFDPHSLTVIRLPTR